MPPAIGEIRQIAIYSVLLVILASVIAFYLRQNDFVAIKTPVASKAVSDLLLVSKWPIFRYKLNFVILKIILRKAATLLVAKL